MKNGYCAVPFVHPSALICDRFSNPREATIRHVSSHVGGSASGGGDGETKTGDAPKQQSVEWICNMYGRDTMSRTAEVLETKRIRNNILSRTLERG